jgi:hypothetical protein
MRNKGTILYYSIKKGTNGGNPMRNEVCHYGFPVEVTLDVFGGKWKGSSSTNC